MTMPAAAFHSIMPRVAPANETGAPRTSGGPLLFVSDGMVSVATGDTVWALWPQRALWVPTGTPYRLYDRDSARSEEHTSELPSLMRISYAVFCLKKIQTINVTN